MVIVRGNQERFYVRWVILLASPRGERVGGTILANGMRGMLRKQVATISRIAEESPWGPGQFAAARVFPTAAQLWAKLGGES